MATAIQKITLSSARDIPFNKLVLSQSNVRRVKAGVSIEEMAESIARRGLIQSLHVRPVLDADGAETGIFEVPAGGRRYRALELLVKQKRLAKTATVPCVIGDANSDILVDEVSLVENMERAPLHPLDQFRAFQAMRDKGMTEEAIAAAFFVSVTVVKQRLRLTSVSPTLLEIYADDGMTLEQLMAFTVSPDHARQEQVWDAIKDSWQKEPYQIRRMLTETAVRASDTFPGSAGVAPDVATLLAWIEAQIPPRLPVALPDIAPPVSGSAPRTVRGYLARAATERPAARSTMDPQGVELAYDTMDWTPPEGAHLTDAIYEEYGLQSIRIASSQAHPTKLVQSAAMASVAPPKPAYRPMLPANITDLLSDAQLETVIYAGEAHSGFLAGSWIVDATCDLVQAAKPDDENAVRFRRGFMLGDGTGAGKGRQSAGIILDNWLRGCRKAVWISKSDKLIEDAQRDWSALGMERLLVTPLSRFPQGRPITLSEGVLFATYATLRSDDRGEKVSRVRQIVEWLGSDFDGVIIFDESHAMANAAGGKGERGDVAASQQGRAGLRLQHALANARVVYVSATGATTVHNLAYAQRLGLWGGEDFPFATRAEFVEAIEDGGVAAMEVLARDLRALGLYTARSLSYDGVEYELIEHALSDEQRRIYDAYASAFAVIHNHLDAAMQAANITGSPDSGGATLNRQAKSAARSAFESAKQRFFGHLLTSMKTPTLIRSIERDLDDGHAAVVQIVSTGEALMERRLAEVPTEEWNDIRVDITPREYV